MDTQLEGWAHSREPNDFSNRHILIQPDQPLSDGVPFGLPTVKLLKKEAKDKQASHALYVEDSALSDSANVVFAETGIDQTKWFSVSTWLSIDSA